MTSNAQDLSDWLQRVENTSEPDEVFQLLDAFRPLTWTDEERSRMSKVYVRVLERIGCRQPPTSSGDVVGDKPDGPVWYEKI